MRLNRFNPNNIRVEDQRGGRFPGGGGGKVGCGTIIIAIIAALVFGVDPAQMLGGLDGGQQQGTSQSSQGGRSTEESCALNQYSQESCAVLASLNETWQPEFEKQAYVSVSLNLYSMAVVGNRVAVRLNRQWGHSTAPRTKAFTSTPVSMTRWPSEWAQGAILHAITSWRTNMGTTSSI